MPLYYMQHSEVVHGPTKLLNLEEDSSSRDSDRSFSVNQRSLENRTKKNWSEEQKRVFIEAMKRHGKEWKHVAKEISSKTEK